MKVPSSVGGGGIRQWATIQECKRLRERNRNRVCSGIQKKDWLRIIGILEPVIRFFFYRIVYPKFSGAESLLMIKWITYSTTSGYRLMQQAPLGGLGRLWHHWFAFEQSQIH